MERYVQGRNEGWNGTKGVKIPMRVSLLNGFQVFDFIDPIDIERTYVNTKTLKHH
jgi:hypothetical protein